MRDRVYRLIERVRSSESNIEDAIAGAVPAASVTVKNLRWFEVVQTRDGVHEDRVRHYQLHRKVGFTLEDG